MTGVGQSERLVLVVGASGCLGRAMCSLLSVRSVPMLVSSRDASASVFVDLQTNPSSWRLPEKSDGGIAFLLAAWTDTGGCEVDPEGAQRVNVDATLALACKLAARGFFLVFPSSSQVFDGTHPQPGPDDAPNPVTVYGRHKAEVEAWLLAEFPTQMAILRFGKVLDGTSGLINRWTVSLLRGEPVEAFDDMYMAPVSTAEAAAALLAVAKSPGIHHFSATRDISYYEAARLGAKILGADPSLVRAESCVGRVLFAPTHTALRMFGPASEPETAVSHAFTVAKANVAV